MSQCANKNLFYNQKKLFYNLNNLFSTLFFIIPIKTTKQHGSFCFITPQLTVEEIGKYFFYCSLNLCTDIDMTCFFMK